MEKLSRKKQIRGFHRNTGGERAWTGDIFGCFLECETIMGSEWGPGMESYHELEWDMCDAIGHLTTDTPFIFERF